MERREAAGTRRIRVAPGSLPATVRLRGGAIVIRRVEPADTLALQQFFRDLSPASRYRRFLRVVRELPEDLLARFTHPDPAREAVLVASLPHSPARIVGMAQFAGDVDADGSEVAVVVGDAWQRQGLGGQLMDALLNVAIAAGIERLHADILADNYAMRRLAQNFGFEFVAHPAGPFLVRAEKMLARELAGTDAFRYQKIVSAPLRPKALPLTVAEQPPRAEAGL
ncbi:MAG TPA: GNAT family N-acetyltransferase [Burkholderiales bacterium]|jgi:acetyltransferase|nr:GNAT family N-acetyltransferase [Burkholderiales bacterium]